jgi:simple sugar transport system ATP-binding protein
VLLFAALERARGRGLGIILITHRLEEALHRADRISVLRRGRLVWSSAVRNGLVDAVPQQNEVSQSNEVSRSTEVPLTEGFLSALLDPEPNPADPCVLSSRAERDTPDTRKPALELDSVSFSEDEREPLRSVSFQAMRGTVTTIAGYPGSGLGTLEDILSGLIAPDEGTVSIGGTKIARSKISPARFRAEGIAVIPSDRSFRGSHPDITIGDLLSPYVKTGFFRAPKTAAQHAAAILAREGIEASPERAARTLSGGQLQRLILARELETDPSIIVFASPEWGLDVNSVERLRVRIEGLAASGKTVIVLTEETGSSGICAPTRVLKDGGLI